MKSRVKVKDHPTLERDLKTNAIISNDKNGYERYMAERNLRESQQSRIDYLETELMEIKRLLMKGKLEFE
tara:strand:- start:6712 stop:6921 length:210 start_codon:yes stop_codon:yes gene_type:complete